MKKISITRERVYLAVLWIISVIVILPPWATSNGEVYYGWGGTFCFPYLIGLIIGLVVLITKARPFFLSLIAGILMMIGVVGGFAAAYLWGATIVLRGGEVDYYPARAGFALIWSFIYTIVASIFGKRMAEK